MQECALCRDFGHACAATHEDDNGRPVCAFCLDDVPCPIQAKQQRASKETPESRPSPKTDHAEKTVNELQNEEKDMQNTGSDTPKLCKRPGCETKLSSANIVGLCARHVRWTGQRPTSGEDHAAAAPNGDQKAARSVGKGANGHAIEDVVTQKEQNGAAAGFLEDRLNMLILSLPVSDKAKIVDCWIRGEL